MECKVPITALDVSSSCALSGDGGGEWVGGTGEKRCVMRLLTVTVPRATLFWFFLATESEHLPPGP